SEALKSGRDFDWTKEMYQSHNSLIIKLPAKYISKLLQKLRNPEKHDAIDSQMGKLLTLYETSYMAIKSTQKKRRK
ncbi:ATP-binding protein, partial [Klebsiella pneumoniae]|nr:ATP-binding protein [Klebsiella pneumoniae]